MKPVQLRPHHGMCIGQFMGKGYSQEFTANMTEVIACLEAAEEEKIQLVCRTDIICGHCPHNENQICSSGQKVLDYDRACLKLCGLEENQHISWQEFKERVTEQIIRKNRLTEVCWDCSWLHTCITHAGINYSK